MEERFDNEDTSGYDLGVPARKCLAVATSATSPRRDGSGLSAPIANALALLALAAMSSCGQPAEKDKYIWSLARGLNDHGPLILVAQCECVDGHAWDATFKDTLGIYYTLPGSEAANSLNFQVGDTIR